MLSSSRYASCGPDAANILLFPLPIETPHKFNFYWPSTFGEKMFEHCGRRQTSDGWTDAGSMLYFTNTNLVPFHTSTGLYLNVFNCENLHVIQSDP